MASLGPTLPGLADHTQTRLSDISILFVTRSLGYLMAALLGGRLYDLAPGHLVMAAVLGATALLMIVAPLILVLWLLAAVLLCLGITLGMLEIGANTLLVWVHGDKVGPFINGLYLFFAVGAFLSLVVIAQAIKITSDFTWAYWVLTLLMLPVLARLLRSPSPTPQVSIKQNPVGPASYPLVALIALFFFLYVGAEVSFAGWIFTFVVSLDLAGETSAALLTAAFWGSLAFGRLLSIPIAGRLRPRYILMGDLVGSLASIILILLWSNSLTAIWLGTLGLGLSMASIPPTTVALAQRRMPITGRVTGLFFIGVAIGGMVLPWLIGQFFELLGPEVTIFVVTADLILALGVLTLLLRYRPTESSGSATAS